MRRAARGCVAAAVAVAATGTIATTASGVPRQVEQRPLVDAATIVRSAVEAQDLTGLSSIVIGDRDVTVWWRGGRSRLPSSLTPALAEARDVARVRVADAEYSRTQLLAASALAEASLGDERAFVGIAARPDGSGLAVTLAEEAGAAARPDLPHVGVPLGVRTAPRPRLAARNDDRAPWSGGARIVNVSENAGCTAGFGIRSFRGPAILTAEHCGNVGSTFTDGAGERIGTVSDGDDPWDVEIVPTSAVSNRIYVGGQTSNEQRTVVDGGAPFVGEVLCQSGNTSAGVVGGPVCNLEVKFEYTDSERLWEATQRDGQTAVRSGDSGGPVYSDRGDGSVIARGTSTRGAGPGFGFAGFEKAQQRFSASIPGAGQVQLYEHCGYGGWGAFFGGTGTYGLSQITAAGGRNDAASMVRVPPGHRVTLYEHDGAGGRSVTVTRDTCLASNGFNDIVSSLRVERP